MTEGRLYAKVLQGMVLLRKAGFVARNNFMCCRSCAGCELCDQVVARGKEISGAAFTTRQDWESWGRRGGRYVAPRSVFIKYGPLNHYEGDKRVRQFGFDTKTCGRLVVEAMREVGLGVEWSGKPDDCIRVCLLEDAEN